MAQHEAVLHGDLEEIERKLNLGIIALSPNTGKRGSWTTTVGNVRCDLLVYEKNAPRVWVNGEHVDQPHYSLSITLVDTGEEIRLCAITSGSNPAPYFLPGSGADAALLEPLKLTLEALDRII